LSLIGVRILFGNLVDFNLAGMTPITKSVPSSLSKGKVKI
jgi:hypothetical protein